MKALSHASVVGAFCACVAGCAGSGTSRVATISPDNAGNAITIGKSTRADVAAALGKTAVVSFDSGFEVWVYQVTGDALASISLGGLLGRAGSEKESLGRTEFVVLFAPSGVVTKTRIRPAPPPRKAKP